MRPISISRANLAETDHFVHRRIDYTVAPTFAWTHYQCSNCTNRTIALTTTSTDAWIALLDRYIDHRIDGTIVLIAPPLGPLHQLTY